MVFCLHPRKPDEESISLFHSPWEITFPLSHLLMEKFFMRTEIRPTLPSLSQYKHVWYLYAWLSYTDKLLLVIYVMLNVIIFMF